MLEKLENSRHVKAWQQEIHLGKMTFIAVVPRPKPGNHLCLYRRLLRQN